MAHPKFLENIVILCFEKRFSKRNSVIRLKSNILAPQKFLGLLRHCISIWMSEEGQEFANFSKNAAFLFRVMKTKFHHFWPPVEKLLEKSTSDPLEKFLPMPMHTSM